MAADSPSPGGWVLLGLLIEVGRSSGYDLVHLATRTIGNFWPITKAHVYAELPKMERLGLLDAEDVQQSRAPAKRVYGATAAGREAFDRWIAGLDAGPARYRSPLLLRLFFGARISEEELARRLADDQRFAKARVDEYRRLLSAENAGDGSERARLFRRLVILHGLHFMEAELRWLAEARQELAAAGGSAGRIGAWP